MITEKKHIGILTIHAAINYGSALQAYALQHRMQAENPNADLEIINYLPACIMDQYSNNILNNMKDIKTFIKFCLNFKNRRIRNTQFKEFSDKFFSLSAENYKSNTELKRDSENWDACILGSDQVWNPDIVEDDPAFWLDFMKEGYKATFSSSFGTMDVPRKYLDNLERELENFDRISVREPSAKDMLHQVNKEITVTCDPVFLLSAEEWSKIERKPDGIPSEYILLYTVEKNEKIEDIVKDISKEYNLPIVDLGVRNNPRSYFGIHSSRFGPQEFIYLIHNAKYVFTNSFHGTAFATIFHKKSISILHRSRGTRIRELCDLAGRMHLILPELATIGEVKKVLDKDLCDDYSLLDLRIEASKQYIKELLNEIQKAN